MVAILTTWSEDDSKKSQRSSIEGCIAAVQEIFEHPIFQRSKHVAIEDILSKSMRLDLSRLSDEVRYITAETVSYTHLDVYKRQRHEFAPAEKLAERHFISIPGGLGEK